MRRIGVDLAADRIHPLPYTAYPVDAVAGAFQILAAREHTRKLVVVFPYEGTVRAVMPADQVTVAREDGAYVITGGLGGLGLPLARHLAEGGAGRVVLGDRVHPDDEAEKTIAALRDAGADIELVLGDLSDPATAPRLVAAATATGLALRGVAHAADAAEEAAIGRIDDDLLDRVWAPKAFGAWHLFGACAGRPLDWWLSFSSSAALVGGHGQAAHAGADGWLDAFTMYACRRGGSTGSRPTRRTVSPSSTWSSATTGHRRATCPTVCPKSVRAPSRSSIAPDRGTVSGTRGSPRTSPRAPETSQ
jgi:NAD(P)-dependent dehydrogenase (short-subunit alcohol dehydrogenase family)